MFIHTSEYTINTDQITWAKEKQNGQTEIHFADGTTIYIHAIESQAIFNYLNGQRLNADETL